MEWQPSRVVKRTFSGQAVAAARGSLSCYPEGLRFSLSRDWHPARLAAARLWLEAQLYPDRLPPSWMMALRGPAGDLEWRAPGFGSLLTWAGPYPLWVAPWAVVGACGRFVTSATDCPLRRVAGEGELILSSPGGFLPLEVEAGQLLDGRLLAAWSGEPSFRRPKAPPEELPLEAQQSGTALFVTRHPADLASQSFLLSARSA